MWPLFLLGERRLHFLLPKWITHAVSPKSRILAAPVTPASLQSSRYSLRLSSVIVKPELLSLTIKQHKFYKAAI